MANTTNYNWETPDDTDLVKDGAAAIRTLGSSVDTTTKALNPSTTLGDIEYRSSTANTNTRLPIGTTGQILSVVAGVPSWVANDVGDITGVTAGTGISGGGTSGDVTVTNSMATAIDAKGDLIGGTGADTFSRLAVGANGTILTADSAEATGLKWATPAGGSSTLVLVKAPTSFSNVAGTGTTFDGVFTSTYTTYLIVIEKIFAATAADDLLFNLRYAGPSTQTLFYGSALRNSYDSSTYSTTLSNATDLILHPQIGNSATTATTSYLTVQNAGSTNYPLISGFSGSLDNSTLFINNGLAGNSRDYTGFLLKSSSSNVTGTVAVYAYARS